MYYFSLNVHVDQLALHLTVDDHDARIQKVESGFLRLESKIDILIEKLSKVERFLYQNTSNKQLQPASSAMNASLSNPVTAPLDMQTSTSNPTPLLSLGRLPSSAIDKSKLLPASVIIKNNSHLAKEGTIGTLAQLLARECFFGEGVMVQCTAHGHGDKPGLPIAELMLLKNEIRKTLPQYWNAPQEMELLWSKCTDLISQACKRLRGKKTKRSQKACSTSTPTTPANNEHESLV